MPFKEYRQTTCPFCNSGQISICRIPSQKVTKRASLGKGGSAAADSWSKEHEWVENDCVKCGKTAKEVEAEFKRVTVVKSSKPLTEKEKLLKEKERVERLISTGYNIEAAKAKLKEIEDKLKLHELSK